jgi:hypothetical protein
VGTRNPPKWGRVNQNELSTNFASQRNKKMKLAKYVDGKEK